MPKKVFIPLVKSGGYFPSGGFVPLVRGNGVTTSNDAKDDDQNDKKEIPQDASDLR